jgi:hypothetical protein
MKLRKMLVGWVFVLTAMALPAQAHASLITAYTWTGGEPTMDARLFRNGVPSDWEDPKDFPGTFAGTFSYVTFEFANPSGDANPFFVDILQSTTTNSFFSVYLNGFDPTNLAQGYLGDAGSSFNIPPLGEQSFSVLVPGGQTAFVMLSTALSDLTFAGETVMFRTTYRDVPEPAGAMLLGVGLAAVSVMRRRRATRNT